MKHLSEQSVIPYLDGRLAPDERAQLERHLEECTDCRTRLAELRSLLDELNRWPAPEPSPAFTAALRARVAAEAPEPATRWNWRWVYAGATALAAVVLLVVVLWQPTPPAAPTPIAETPETLTEETGDELATLEPLLLENYDLLHDFDILFETQPNREASTTEQGT